MRSDEISIMNQPNVCEECFGTTPPRSSRNPLTRIAFPVNQSRYRSSGSRRRGLDLGVIVWCAPEPDW
jgi:hypothetical protein